MAKASSEIIDIFIWLLLYLVCTCLSSSKQLNWLVFGTTTQRRLQGCFWSVVFLSESKIGCWICHACRIHNIYIDADVTMQAYSLDCSNSSKFNEFTQGVWLWTLKAKIKGNFHGGHKQIVCIYQEYIIENTSIPLTGKSPMCVRGGGGGRGEG